MLTYDQRHHRLYAADDFGVFYLRNGNPRWVRLGLGMPNTPVLDIKLTGDGKWMYAATFGRSVWRLSLPPTF
jgi:hypothetical protein